MPDVPEKSVAEGQGVQDIALEKRNSRDEALALTAAGAAIGAALPSGLAIAGVASTVLGGVLMAPLSPILLALVGAGGGALIKAWQQRRLEQTSH